MFIYMKTIDIFNSVVNMMLDFSIGNTIGHDSIYSPY